MRCFKHLVQNCIAVGEMPPHQFEIITGLSDGDFSTNHKWSASIASVPDNTVTEIGSGYRTAGTNRVGSGMYHNNVTPCVASYVWRRTA